ncbi:MAG: hypothetical protein NVSMB57_13500 [Actinomycetota bacterium]
MALQERISFEKNVEEIGRVHEVLVEGRSRKDADVLKTRTRSNKILHVPDPASGNTPAGSFLQAVVKRAHPYHLMGEALA